MNPCSAWRPRTTMAIVARALGGRLGVFLNWFLFHGFDTVNCVLNLTPRSQDHRIASGSSCCLSVLFEGGDPIFWSASKAVMEYFDKSAGLTIATLNAPSFIAQPETRNCTALVNRT